MVGGHVRDADARRKCGKVDLLRDQIGKAKSEEGCARWFRGSDVGFGLISTRGLGKAARENCTVLWRG
jgi:hypothetical protein